MNQVRAFESSRKVKVSPTETVGATNDAKKDGVKREISVEIPADEVARETETIVQKYQKVARLPGFRPGHVPASIIKQRFKEDLKSDVVEALVPRYFRKEAEKQGLIPVSQPQVTDLHIHDGEPLRFKASFEVMPEIVVEGYKELRADHPEIAVNDEEVEDALNNVREQHATFTSVEGRPLADGDFAQSSLGRQAQRRRRHGQARPHGRSPDRNRRQEHRAGVHRKPARRQCRRRTQIRSQSIPKTTHDKRLAGKTFVYTVKVQAIKQKSLAGTE